MNEQLSNSTYLTGDVITIGDIIMYYAVYGAIKSMPHTDRYSTFSHVIRWFINVS